MTAAVVEQRTSRAKRHERDIARAAYALLLIAHLLDLAIEKARDDAPHAFGLVAWRSHKIQRAHDSTLLAETLGLAEGIAELEWIQVLWCEMLGWRDVEGS